MYTQSIDMHSGIVISQAAIHKAASGTDQLPSVTATVQATLIRRGPFEFEIQGWIHEDALGRWIDWRFPKDGFKRP